MSRLNILVVDDDRDFAESLADVLELEGHRVELAFSGEQGVQRFREMTFDIAFMDVRLPGMNGVESCREIRKLRPRAKVIMMTGFSVGQLLDQAVENGAWAVLDKPLDLRRVLAMLEQIKPHGILIVDDDADFADGIAEILVNHGYHVYVAHTGEEALERVRNDGIDVLILDLRLPVLSGLEVYLELKRTSHAVPTIIVTAYADQESEKIDKLHSLPVSGILTKPFDPKKLLGAVERICTASRE